MKILVTMPRSIGDAIQTLPAIGVLTNSKEIFQINILTNNPKINLFKDFFKIKANYLDSSSPLTLENINDYNFLVDFGGHFSSHSIKSSNYVTHTVFHDPEVMLGAKCIVVNDRLKESRFFNAVGFYPRPAWSLYYEMIIAANFSGKIVPEDYLFKTSASNIFKPKSRNIGIIPCGSLKSKHWDIKNYISLIKYYKGKGLISDVYLGPNEKSYIKYFSKKKLACNVYYNLSLIDLARKLYLNRLVISNDCGPMHIAGYLGVPLLGIFNETLPVCWFPYKRKGQIPLGGNTKIIFNGKLINKNWPTLKTVIKKANRELCIHD
jgi:ADP-heptose:LPS heptosyltransferase